VHVSKPEVGNWLGALLLSLHFERGRIKNSQFDVLRCLFLGPCLFASRPYKDPLLITAQAFSLAAIIFSWGYWATGLLGFAGFIMLQVVWCCKMNKCGLITAGVFCLVDAAGNLIAGCVLIAVANDDDEDLWDDDEEDVLNIWAIICFIGCGLWVATAICVFVFVCNGRLERLERAASTRPPTNQAKMPTVTASAIDAPATDLTSKVTPADMVELHA
jgi:hypothetical protein